MDISRKLRDALRAEAIKTGMRQPQLVRWLLAEALAFRRKEDTQTCEDAASRHLA